MNAYRATQIEALTEQWPTRVYYWLQRRRASAAWLLVRGVVLDGRHREASEVELIVPVEKFTAIGRAPWLVGFVTRQIEFHHWNRSASTRFFLRPQRVWDPGSLDLTTCGGPRSL